MTTVRPTRLEGRGCNASRAPGRWVVDMAAHTFAKDNRMKTYPDDWQVRLTTGVVSAICIGAALIVVGFDRFWPLMLSLVVAIIVGNVLGRLVCRLLFRTPEMEKKDE